MSIQQVENAFIANEIHIFTSRHQSQPSPSEIELGLEKYSFLF